MIKAYTDYSPFQTEDFLDDPSFRAWIARPTPEMTAYWRGLLQTYPHLREPFEQAHGLAQGLVVSWTSFSDVYTQQLYDRIHPAVITTPPHAFGTAVRWMHPARRRRYGAVAAGLLLVAGLWVKAYFFTGHTYQTRFAQTRTLSLYDGSTATLNANSRLSVPSRYAWRQARTVMLTGEAYFSVRKQATLTGYRRLRCRPAGYPLRYWVPNSTYTPAHNARRCGSTRVAYGSSSVAPTGPYRFDPVRKLN